MNPEPITRWPQYYKATAGREPRPLLMTAIALCAHDPNLPPDPLALDLGCGDGTDTLALLEHHWRVLAMDSTPEGIELLNARVSPEFRSRLETRVVGFADMILPPAELIYAGFSIPFCHPSHFDQLWSNIIDALPPGGRFAGHIFGDRDEWATDTTMTFHTREQLDARLSGLAIEHFYEMDEDGTASCGPKHWHRFEVIVRKGG